LLDELVPVRAPLGQRLFVCTNHAAITGDVGRKDGSERRSTRPATAPSPFCAEWIGREVPCSMATGNLTTAFIASPDRDLSLGEKSSRHPRELDHAIAYSPVQCVPELRGIRGTDVYRMVDRLATLLILRCDGQHKNAGLEGIMLL
jgi:hypothetical protein